MKVLSEATPMSVSLVIVVLGVIYKLGGLVNQTEAKDIEHDHKIIKIEDKVEQDVNFKHSIDRRLTAIEFKLGIRKD